MIDKLPIEIIDLLLVNHCKNIIDPIDFHNLKYINVFFKKHIHGYKQLYKMNDHNGHSFNDKLNRLCCKKTSVHMIQWLLDNNIFFSLNHIKNFIIYNRVDIIKLGLTYEPFTKTILNRFMLYYSESNERTYIETNNPLILAGKYNRIDIIKLLLIDTRDSIIMKLKLNCLFDISILHNHKQLLNYLCINYLSIIKHKIKKNIYEMNHKLYNIEDINFYLLHNHIIEPNFKFLNMCISHNYRNLFYYCYPLVKIKIYNKLINSCFIHSNIELLNYIFIDKQCIITNDKFTNMITSQTLIKYDFLMNLLQNHISNINKDSNLINVCIINKIPYDMIQELLLQGFKISFDDIKLVVNMEHRELLKLLINYL